MAALPNGRIADAGQAALRDARNRVSFDVEAMTCLLNGGESMTQLKRACEAEVVRGTWWAGHMLFLSRQHSWSTRSQILHSTRAS